MAHRDNPGKSAKGASHDSALHPGPRVLIGGIAYGMGNVGDEGILQAIVWDIRDVAPMASITVLTWKPKSTAKLLGVRAVRTRVHSLLRESMRSDIVICGGGSIIAEYYDKKAWILEKLKGYPGYPLTLISLAKLWRKKVMVYAVGVEPVESTGFRRWIAHSLRLADKFTVRDEASKHLLTEWGDASRVRIAADPAFSLRVPSPRITDQFLREQGISLPEQSLLVGMSFAYEPRFVKMLHEQIDFYTELAQRLIAENNAYIVLIPMNTDPVLDRQGLAQVAQNLPADRVVVLQGDYHPSQIIGLASRLDLVISSRMHLLIFSAIAKTPFGAISRGPKIDAFARRFETEPIAYVKHLDVREAKSRVEGVLRSAIKHKEVMSPQLARMRSLLEVNRESLRELLASSHS